MAEHSAVEGAKLKMIYEVPSKDRDFSWPCFFAFFQQLRLRFDIF